MNKQRRKELERIVSAVDCAIEDLLLVIEEEELALNNMPDSLKSAMVATNMEDNIGGMTDGLNCLYKAKEMIVSGISSLDEAASLLCEAQICVEDFLA